MYAQEATINVNKHDKPELARPRSGFVHVLSWLQDVELHSGKRTSWMVRRSDSSSCYEYMQTDLLLSALRCWPLCRTKVCRSLVVLGVGNFYSTPKLKYMTIPYLLSSPMHLMHNSYY